MSEVPTPDRFKRLPQPIPRGRLRTSVESGPRPAEKDDGLREIEWMLRASGG